MLKLADLPSHLDASSQKAAGYESRTENPVASWNFPP